MDKEPKKEHKLPSMVEISEMFDKVQSQMRPLSYNLEKLNNIQEIASQYEHLNRAMRTGETARKIFEQQNLASANVIASSVSTSLAQPQIREAVALQDSFRKIAEGLSVNNNAKLVSENTMKGIYINDLYKDTLESIGRLKESLEPWRDSFSIASKAFNGSEFANLVRELQTSKIIPESTLSEYSGIFEQFESLKNLESFKAISRLENFPNDKVWTQNYDKAHEITEDSLAEAKSIDASISDEVSSVDDFNELSEERQNILLSLYSNYYYPIILTYLVVGIWWNVFLNENLNLSNRIFVYFESTKGVFSYLDAKFYRPSSGVIDGIVATLICMKFPEFKKNSKEVGVKKAIKMLFHSSDYVINHSMLKGCRVITEDNTYLRENHHIDATQIEILSKGTIVKIVEKEGKSWLLVEPLFNTEIGKGWILRSETTTFK